MPTQNENLSQEQLIREIHENTNKTKSYMKWQLIITMALVVIPVLAMLIIIPLVISSLSSVYSSAGLLQ